jgi:hypothetical protein
MFWPMSSTLTLDVPPPVSLDWPSPGTYPPICEPLASLLGAAGRSSVSMSMMPPSFMPGGIFDVRAVRLWEGGPCLAEVTRSQWDRLSLLSPSELDLCMGRWPDMAVATVLLRQFVQCGVARVAGPMGGYGYAG